MKHGLLLVQFRVVIEQSKIIKGGEFMKYPKGIHKYRIDGEEVLAEYIGRQKGFECIICGKGHNAYTFNIFHDDNLADIAQKDFQDYETWGFGKEHLEEAVQLIE